MSRWMDDAGTQADYAEPPPEDGCEWCGASPSFLFDHTPLAESGTWERLCNDCIEKVMEPQPECGCPHDERDQCVCDEHCPENGMCEGWS